MIFSSVYGKIGTVALQRFPAGAASEKGEMNMSTTTMGGRIKYHRKRLNLTQEQLAERMGVSAQAVSKWENEFSHS